MIETKTYKSNLFSLNQSLCRQRYTFWRQTFHPYKLFIDNVYQLKYCRSNFKWKKELRNFLWKNNFSSYLFDAIPCSDFNWKISQNWNKRRNQAKHITYENKIVINHQIENNVFRRPKQCWISLYTQPVS